MPKPRAGGVRAGHLNENIAVYLTHGGQEGGGDLEQAVELQADFVLGCIDAEFSSEASFESSRRDLHNTHFRTALQYQLFVKIQMLI